MKCWHKYDEMIDFLKNMNRSKIFDVYQYETHYGACIGKCTHHLPMVGATVNIFSDKYLRDTSNTVNVPCWPHPVAHNFSVQNDFLMQTWKHEVLKVLRPSDFQPISHIIFVAGLHTVGPTDKHQDCDTVGLHVSSSTLHLPFPHFKWHVSIHGQVLIDYNGLRDGCACVSIFQQPAVNSQISFLTHTPDYASNTGR